MNSIFLRDDHEEHVEKVKQASAIRDSFMTRLFARKEKKLAQALVEQDPAGNDTEITIEDFKKNYNQIDKRKRKNQKKDTFGL